MDIDAVKRQMDLATQSARDQLTLNKEMVANNFDAGDRLLLRKAADVTLQIAEVAAFGGNPT